MAYSFTVATDNDLKQIIHLIALLSEEQETPFSLLLSEISVKGALTIMCHNEVRPLAYISGYLVNPETFYVSQIYSLDPICTKQLYETLEEKVKEMKVTKITAYTKLHPRVFRRWGFEVERYIVTKEV